MLDENLYHLYLYKVHIVHSVKMISRKYQYMLHILVLGILQDPHSLLHISNQYFQQAHNIVCFYLKNPNKLPNSISCSLEPFLPCLSRRLSSGQDLFTYNYKSILDKTCRKSTFQKKIMNLVWFSYHQLVLKTIFSNNFIPPSNQFIIQHLVSFENYCKKQVFKEPKNRHSCQISSSSSTSPSITHSGVCLALPFTDYLSKLHFKN